MILHTQHCDPIRIRTREDEVREAGYAFLREREGKLKQGTKVVANGYPGVIVRHYDGEMYEIRLPGGVVCTDQWELPETAGTKYADNKPETCVHTDALEEMERWEQE